MVVCVSMIKVGMGQFGGSLWLLVKGKMVMVSGSDGRVTVFV